MKLIPFHDLHGRPDFRSDAEREGGTSISSIDKDVRDFGELSFVFSDGLQCPVPIRHIRRCDADGMGKTVRIHKNMAFNAGNLLSRVIPLLFRRIDILHALSISDAETRLGVPSIFDTPFSNQFFLRSVPAGSRLHPHAIPSIS